MIVLICGSRDWTDRDVIRRELEQLPAGTTIIHGDCGRDAQGRYLWGQDDHLAVRGADKLAGAIARELGFEVRAFPPPEWVAGNFVGSAGPKRNTRMLQERPDLCLAFTRDLRSSRGTADMCRKARAAGVEVRVIKGKGASSG